MNTYQACQVLDVDSESSFDDIKYAYRKLALELHPDKNNKESDGKKFKRVTEAYHFLKNYHKKENSKHIPKSDWKYTNTKNEQTFKSKPQWGAPQGDKIPEEDWGRFTREFEDANPNFWKQYEKEFWEKYESRKNTDSNKDKEFKESKKSEQKINLSVDVDPTLCIGCCSCETIAPEVFTVDKLTKLNPKSHVYNEKGAGYNKIMDAAETCPTKAISVEDKDAKRKLFPW